MFFSNKKGFTLVEAMIAVVVLSVGMMGVISVITYSLDFVDRTRQDIIATNLAREGMEAVYNMRDTNWVKWSGKKDKCWLKKDPLKDDGNDGCENDLWMGSGKYIVSGSKKGSQEYFKLEKNTSNDKLNLNNGISDEDKYYKMCVENGYWYNCPSQSWDSDDIKEGRFFRQIIGKGLYDKHNDSSLEGCLAGDEDADNGTACGTSLAKEYRFCSKVEYMGGGGQGETELCGVITNFKN